MMEPSCSEMMVILLSGSWLTSARALMRRGTLRKALATRVLLLVLMSSLNQLLLPPYDTGPKVSVASMLLS
jgi:hypothetical protein